MTTTSVPGTWRAALLQVESQWMWYRRYWRSNLYSSGLQPVLFLAAMGLGFGSQVSAGEATGGVSYLHYIAPAMLLVGSLWLAVGEASFPTLSGFKWQRNYVAIVATPITPGQIVLGRLLWVAVRLALAAVMYAAVAALFGAWTNLGVLAVVGIGVLMGLAFAAPVLALAAATHDEGNRFVLMFRLVIMPAMLFSGTFFPIEQLPLAVRPLAWLSPLWHATELARGFTIGGLHPAAGMGHLAALVTVLAVGAVVARHYFTRRLVR